MAWRRAADVASLASVCREELQLIRDWPGDVLAATLDDPIATSPLAPAKGNDLVVVEQIRERQPRITKHGLSLWVVVKEGGSERRLPSLPMKVHFCAATPCGHKFDPRTEPLQYHLCALRGLQPGEVADLSAERAAVAAASSGEPAAALGSTRAETLTGADSLALVPAPITGPEQALAPASHADVVAVPEAQPESAGAAALSAVLVAAPLQGTGEALASASSGALAAQSLTSLRRDAQEPVALVNAQDLRQQNMLALALELGKARAWTGISAFLVFALAHKVRVRLLLGGSMVDVVETYTPWLAESIPLPKAPSAHAMNCIIARSGDGDGSTVLRHPVGHAECGRTNHWVRCMRLGESVPVDGHAPCSGQHCRGWGPLSCAAPLYAAAASHGHMPLPTEAQGDCGVHCMCNVLGWVSNETNKMLVRRALRLYLATHSSDATLQDALMAAGEHLDDASVTAAWDEILIDLERAGIIAEAGLETSSESVAAVAAEGAPVANAAVAVVAEADLPVADAAAPIADVGVAAASAPADDGEVEVGGGVEPWPNALAWVTSHCALSPCERAELSRRLSLQEKQELESAYGAKATPVECDGADPAVASALAEDAPAAASAPAGGNGAAPTVQPQSLRQRKVIRPKKNIRRRVGARVNKSHLLKNATHDGADLAAWCAERQYNVAALPYGAVVRYVHERNGDPKQVVQNSERRYLARCAKKAVASGGVCASGRLLRSKNSALVGLKGGRRRRRAGGTQGAPRKAVPLREALFDWFCEARKTIKGRMFSSTLISQARSLRLTYITECLRQRVIPDAPKAITHVWVRRWRREYGVSLRRPNKRYKVPRSVFMERVRILWCNTLRIRVLSWLCWGRDTVVEGFDQKPFHMSEAGSKNQKTLALRGDEDVVLKENHAHTRERWSANTFVTSCPRRAEAIPPLELMFRGGSQVDASLQAIKPADAPWLSITTGPKASYRIDDVLACLETHLEKVPALAGSECESSRDWRIMMCDAYAGHEESSLRRLCWARGYILIKHGGGTTGAMAVNDTDLHMELSRQYQDLEQAAAWADLELRPNGCPSRSRADCVADISAIWRQPGLHQRAAAGFTRNLLTNALDGSEDHLASQMHASLWAELGMPKLRDQIVEEVCASWEAGCLKWSFEDVYSLVEDYPARGHADVYDPRRADEEPDSDKEAPPWDDDPGGSDMGSPPASEAEELAPASESLDQAVADEAQRYAESLAKIDRMIEEAEALGNDSIVGHLRRARHTYVKNAHGSRQSDARVAQAVARAEMDRRRALRVRQQEAEACQRSANRLAKESGPLVALAADLRAQQAEVRRLAKTACLRQRALANSARARAAEERRQRQQALAAVPREFDAEMFGQGLARGGARKHELARMDCLERIKRSAPALPASAEVNWDRFKTQWDRACRFFYDKSWGSRFRTLMLDLISGVQGGDTSAMSVFVERQSRRWVRNTDTLQAPARKSSRLGDSAC